MCSKTSLVVAVLVLALSGCSWFCKKCPPVPPKEPPRESCLSQKPPKLMTYQVDLAGQGDCTPGGDYVACLTAAAANAISTNTERLIKYVRDAWTECGPETPEEPGESGAETP
jgi:hypothetical protein